MADHHGDGGGWSADELCKAEEAASRFLEENGSRIAGMFRAKAEFLEVLIHRMSLRVTSFDDRLDSLAQISEIAQLIQADANNFFALASQPAVARILGTVERIGE